ncbi:hypothetical protein CSV79_09800 [Sporosarcina sp. P13]|uniref:PulJ/GspJ family protein n=1 Tax=Sporosarcina sp. P13 TaxID=2048263 RepID=UPI000C16DD72|nr:type II secretion system protein [Sporosarcina sp. P13]PIC63844.1 hypothetical protein CSV79_09800 [Sporosarcina sp. P13]
MKVSDGKGFTLVEVLAALTVLGIVFVGFMTIYPQMTNFNARTEAKLETMNLAKRELAFWKENPLLLEDNNQLTEIPPDHTSKPGYIIYEYTYEAEPSFKYQVTYKTATDLTAPLVSEVSLHRIHVVVFKGDREVSETFGYMEKPVD